jgi:hypothetical protein
LEIRSKLKVNERIKEMDNEKTENLASKILGAFEEKREGACTCRPKVVNGKNLYLGAQEVYGCLIHCTHDKEKGAT